VNLVFLFPETYRPFKEHFARRFELLSRRCSGFIFTLSAARYIALPLARFQLYSEPLGRSTIGHTLRTLLAQVARPLRVLRNAPRIDAVVTYDPYASGFAGVILTRLFPARLIIEINGDYHTTEPSQNPLKKSLMRFLFHFSLANSAAIKVLNMQQQDYFGRLYPRTPIYRFHDFVPVDYFQSLDCYQGNYLLAVGHPFDIKGVDLLIQAFARISERHPDIHLRIMGYSPKPELMRYEHLVNKNPRVHFIPPGWIEDVGEQMRGCYALVNAARSEAMGKVHLEAMACAKPLVATRTNGGITCIEEGRTGLLSDINDVAALAENLDYLLSNPSLAASMGEAGRERLRGNFSEEMYVHSLLSMLEEVVGPHR